MKPNIFEISTKELAQDGFITWLLKWADPSNKMYNEKLNLCAMNFVKFLVAKQCDESFEVTKVNAGRQWQKIDVWADVNEKYCIIIEDKIYTGEHSNQLERYRKIATDWCLKNNRKLVRIYLKTGTEAMSSLKSIATKGVSVVERRDLISFLENYDIKNDIFEDFVAKIVNIENSEKAFETKLIKYWDKWSCWTGFYHFLDSMLEIADWKYVSNPSGGFLGVWWHFLKWKDYSVYLQIENGKLCFKIAAHKNTAARNEWYNIVMKKAKETNRNEIQKPSRFGKGTYMTVAKIERKNWLGDDNEIIDKENVIKKLQEYEAFLDYCLK